MTPGIRCRVGGVDGTDLVTLGRARIDDTIPHRILDTSTTGFRRVSGDVGDTLTVAIDVGPTTVTRIDRVDAGTSWNVTGRRANTILPAPRRARLVFAGVGEVQG